MEGMSSLKEPKSFRNSPINTLPDDVLTLIFHLVRNFRLCMVRLDRFDGVRVPNHLNLLTHICSRWRQLAINTRTLWSHVDLALGDPRHRGLLDRAETYADRAGDIPLHVHLIYLDPAGWSGFSTQIERFFSLVATQAAHLEVFLHNITPDEFCGQALGSCLKRCIPGVLTKLTLFTFGDSYFIFPHDSSRVLEVDWRLLVPRKHLESLWEGVTVLRLNGLFLYWDSIVYHNLVELCLSAHCKGSITLSEPRLVAILKSSPRLRAIHIGLRFIAILPEDAQIVPVRLENLEVLSIDSDRFDRILRWVAPGSLRLQLSITGTSSTIGFVVNSIIIDFFKRSNLAVLRLAVMRARCPVVADILWRLPDLQTLVLNTCDVRINSLDDVGAMPMSNRHSLAQPSSVLYLHACETTLRGLRWMSEQNLARQIVLADCTFSQGAGISQSFVTQHDVCERFPGVEFLPPGRVIQLPSGLTWSDEWTGGVEPLYE